MYAGVYRTNSKTRTYVCFLFPRFSASTLQGRLPPRASHQRRQISAETNTTEGLVSARFLVPPCHAMPCQPLVFKFVCLPRSWCRFRDEHLLTLPSTIPWLNALPSRPKVLNLDSGVAGGGRTITSLRMKSSTQPTSKSAPKQNVQEFV